ncbi:MAG: tail fiber domain-containing protein [Bacteroidota bacterium]
MKQRLYYVLFLFLMASPAFAQFVPEGFNYQSAVRNANGDPMANQTVTLLFSIRSGAQNGPVAYSEKQTTTTNQFGLVSLIIGQGTAIQGVFNDINWGGGAKYLNVSLETTPNVFDELGSSQLLSVPYALYSKYAVNGSTQGSGDDWGTQTVITNPTLIGNGTGGNPLGLAPQSAAIGQVLKWNGTTWAPAEDISSTGQNGGTVTQINTGTGLSGGPITNSGTISLTNTGVTPNTYGSASEIPVLSIDAQGRITAVGTAVPSPGTVGIIGSTGINVQQNGTNFTITNTGDPNAADDIISTSQSNGDVTGPFSNLQIKTDAVGSAEIADNAVGSAEIADNAVGSSEIADNAVGSTEIANNAVGTNEIANGAVTAAKLSDMSATNGQVLKWNGTVWAPAADLTGGSTLNLSQGSGISITGTSPNLTITNTGDTNAADDLTNTSTANGDVSGLFSNLQIKADVITTTELATNAVTTENISNGAVTAAKIDDMGALNGQVLKWNGTTWAPAADLTGGGGGGQTDIFAGAGIDVIPTGNGFTIVNTGDTNGFDDITNSSIADGDVSGPFSDLQLKTGVVTNNELAADAVGTTNVINGAITGVKINNMGAANGQVLKWNGTTWAPANDVGGGSGDNWGTQVAVTGATLSGSGTAASPLNIAQQGATTGQHLRWNGSSWFPANDTWGVQSAATDATITGNGTSAAPLKLAAQNASVGQVLKWNGSSWAPGTDLTSGGSSNNSYSPGTGITITGTAPNFTINNAGDLSNTNELQNLSLNGNILTISGTGSNVNLSGVGAAGLWQAGGNDIRNTNTGNVLIGTSTSTTGKLQVLSSNGPAATFALTDAASTAPALSAVHSGVGAGAYFSSTTGPALLTAEGNVGIGNLAPEYKLDVKGNAHFFGIGTNPALKLEGDNADYVRTYMQNTSPGFWTMLAKGGNPGEFALEFSKTLLQSNRILSARGDGSVFIGMPSGVVTKTTIYQGDDGLFLQNNINSHSWEFWVNSLNGSLSLYNDQLGTVAPAGTFAVNGLYTPSDSRLKRDIMAIPGGVLDKILKLKPVQYHYKSEKADAPTSIGFLAQEVQVLFPEIVGETPARNGQSTYLSLNYAGIGVLAVKAIQEQQNQIESLKKENEDLKKRLDRLEKMMEQAAERK